MKYLPTMLLLVLMGACSNQQAYYGGQASAKIECQKLPSKQDYDDCIARNSSSYDEYAKEREDYLNERQQDNRDN